MKLTPDTVLSMDSSVILLAGKQMKRNQLVEVCQFVVEQQQQQAAQENAKLTRSNKRHLDEISTLKNEMESKVDYLKHNNDSLQNKSQQLEETLTSIERESCCAAKQPFGIAAKSSKN